MAQIVKNITVDVASENTFRSIVAKQHDANSRFLRVRLTNEKEELNVDATSSVMLNALREDGNDGSFAGTVNADGTVTVPITQWMLELDGIVKCDISVITTDSRKLTSTSFTISVEEAVTDGQHILDDENTDVLIKLIADAESVLENIDGEIDEKINTQVLYTVEEETPTWAVGNINRTTTTGTPNSTNKKYNYSSYLRVDDVCVAITKGSKVALCFYTNNTGANNPHLIDSFTGYLTESIKVKEKAPSEAKYYRIVVGTTEGLDIDATDEDGKLYGANNVRVLGSSEHSLNKHISETAEEVKDIARYYSDVTIEYSKLKEVSFKKGGLNIGYKSDGSSKDGSYNEFQNAKNSTNYLPIEDVCIYPVLGSKIALYFYQNAEAGVGSYLVEYDTDYSRDPVKVLDYAPDQANYYKIVVSRVDAEGIGEPDSDGKYFGDYNVKVFEKLNKNNANFDELYENVNKIYEYVDSEIVKLDYTKPKVITWGAGALSTSTGTPNIYYQDTHSYTNNFLALTDDFVDVPKDVKVSLSFYTTTTGESGSFLNTTTYTEGSVRVLDNAPTEAKYYRITVDTTNAAESVQILTKADETGYSKSDSNTADEIQKIDYSQPKTVGWQVGTINKDTNGFVNGFSLVRNVTNAYLPIDDDYIIVNKGAKIDLAFYTRNDGSNSPHLLDSYVTGIENSVKVKDYAPIEAKYYKIVAYKVEGGNIDTAEENGKLFGENNVSIFTWSVNIDSIFNYAKYNMPIVSINGDFASIKQKADLINCSYSYVNGSTIKKGYCTAKWQGSSSLAYPKKNFTIKFYKDEACSSKDKFEAKSGWGNEYKYCFKANWVDSSHCRNVVAAQLWGDIVKSRADVETEGTISNILSNAPNGGAIDGFSIFLVINGQWQGIYNWNIPKDDWTMAMGDDIGQKEVILCASGDNTATFRQEAVVGTDDSLPKDFDLEYATDEDEPETITGVQNSVNNLINLVINSDGGNIDTDIAKYLDIQSAIDYMLYAVLIDNYDGMSKNYLLCSYDYEKNGDYGKWFFGAYDLDSVFGNTVNGKPTSDGHAYRPFTYGGIGSVTSSHKLFQLLWKYKKDEVKARYKELTEGAMSVSSVTTRFCDFISRIPLNAYDADARLWTGIYNTSTNNLTQIISWYENRLKFLDSTMK